MSIVSDCSLLDGASTPEEIAERITEIGSDACAITEHGSLSSSIQFLQKMEKVGKKPILGIEAYICDQHSSIQTPDNRKLTHLPMLCKNTKGWKTMLKIYKYSNEPEHSYYNPRISLEELKGFIDGNIIAFSGHLGSHIANAVMQYGVDAGVKAANYLQSIFGKGNFWLEAQLFDGEHNPDMVKCTNLVRQVAQKTGIPIIATPDAHYAFQHQAKLQRILLCSNMKTTLSRALLPDFPLRGFFVSNRYYIPSYEDMISFGHSAAELEETNKVAALIEKYDILQPPQLPKFDCPNNMDNDEYLTELCRAGWKKLIAPNIPREKWPEYAERVKYELDVFKKNKLAGYFLILWDIIQFCEKNDILTGPGRGSAAGCMVSYLIGLTKIEPIQADLLFSRFFNEGRKGSMPDIDTDFEVKQREKVVEYIRKKYGEDRVGQILTFQNIKGRKAITEVFRAYGDMPHEDIKVITKEIIEEHKITDELQAMEEATGESSIIMWCLENKADKFKDWCRLEDGKLVGPYAERFELAIKLEGLKASQGKHPAGIVIAPTTMEDICPMVLDNKTKHLIGGLTMSDMESIGLVKLDILGTAVLDKLKLINKLNPKFPLDPNTLDFKDQLVWDLFASGKTVGCWQLESRFGQQSCKRLKPEKVEHLSALSSILRPGCLNAYKEDGKCVTDHFIMKKNNEEQIGYIHDALEPLLNKTYGELIYQEQAMAIAKELAGFSLSEADTLRKAIGKKKADVMAEMKIKFMEGITKVGKVPYAVGEQIFSWIEASQRYSFNKCINPSTLVELKNGELQTLLDLNIGEEIKTPYGYSKVVNKYNNGIKELVEVTLESGKTIECTLEHKFLTDSDEILPLKEIIIQNCKIVCELD